MNEPSLVQFIISIAGAAALLIWAVRLVRTGVERGFANQLRLWVRHSKNNRGLAALSGLGAAVFLQSSTAVAVLASNFVAKGGLVATAGLAILLGADVGSAIVTQILIVKQPLLIPLLLLIGAGLFLRGSSGTLRQIGRIMIGLALIFVSLDMIREATGPLVGNSGTQSVMAYLGRDLITAFLIGSAFAWIVHSSVASVLLFVTLAGQGILPPTAAGAMVLGANLGGAVIAYVLTLSGPIAARQMVVANLILRGGGAALVAVAISLAPDLLFKLGADPARQTINLHLLFNLVLAILALPIIGPVIGVVSWFLSEKPQSIGLETVSALDSNALEKPSRGLDCAARELLSMGQRIERMLVSAGPLYDAWNPEMATVIKGQDKRIKQMHLDVKLYLAKLGRTGLGEEESRRTMELANISTSLDAASDTIVRILLPMAKMLNTEQVNFSDKGRKEIFDFYDRIIGNVQLALNVMLNQNPAEARELIEAKEKVRNVEQKLQRQHLGRLRQGLVESIETSNVHQETLRALKQINTSFSMVGYPILAKTGDLLESRLA